MMKMQQSNRDADSGNAAVVARGIETLLSCAQACTACADACVRGQNLHSLVQCIRLNLDCADICVATAALASRAIGANDEVLLRSLDISASAAERSAAECERHAAHDESCARCAAEFVHVKRRAA